ncbi:MAG: acetate non-utilizing protein 9 [Lichina confinis]|nr:MAG: acetate non-utilizing protein 9 [Lichina confinis]
MKFTTRLLFATPTSIGWNKGLQPAPLNLLPPMPLYRRLLRAHRHKLPKEQRLMGDEYVKAEFRRHRDVDNPLHIIGFLTEWQLYAQAIEDNAWRDAVLERDMIDKMSGMQRIRKPAR